MMLLKWEISFQLKFVTMDKESRKIGLSAKLVQLRKEQGQKKESADQKNKVEEKKEGFFAKALRAFYY